MKASSKNKKNTQDLLDLIKNQREKKKKVKFKGTFSDYLTCVLEDPGIVKTSHQRLYDAIERHGVNKMANGDPRKSSIFEGENIKIYDYFDSEFFGMEKVISKLMRFLKSASHRGEESRQVLLLMGPVGAGKSALTEHIKAALEGVSFYCLDGDPQRGEPLQLVPRSLREDFEKKLGVVIEGDLSPVARHILLEDLDGQYENFPVKEMTYSQRARRGIASVPPMDANSQDVTVLIGSEDISKLDKYSEDDPRILSLNGAFNVGNRGIVEFIEVFKTFDDLYIFYVLEIWEINFTATSKYNYYFIFQVFIH